jgi:hypothetical protein
MKTILISLLLCSTACAQGWIENDESPEQWLTDLKAQQVSMETLLGELRTVMDEVKAATEEAKAAASDATSAANEARALRTSNMSAVDAAIAELQSRPYFTEEQIREFAREEAKKLVATVQMPDGTSKQVVAKDVVPVAEKKDNVVQITGYAGTFEVPEGGYISHIDGQPVARQQIVASAQAARIVGNVPVAGVTRSYSIHATRQGSGIRFFATPRATTCRIVNGVQVCN